MSIVMVTKGILGQIEKGEDEKVKEIMMIMRRIDRESILDLLMLKKTSVLIEIGDAKYKEKEKKKEIKRVTMRIGGKNVLDLLMKKKTSVPI